MQIMQVKQLSPNALPIVRHLPKLVDLIQNNPVVVISGKTGCGKSTQVPKAIWKHNPKAKIAVCQPRRVAATSLAIRVASEVGCKIGSSVGYHIGMQSFKSQNCSIIYMTYGILIQQLLFQYQLPYTHIVLDQIHQRSLQMDFSFVALKNLMNQRKVENKSVSKLIIMSATLDSQQFAKYFATNLDTGLFFIPTIKSKQNQQNQQSRQSQQNRYTNRRGTRHRHSEIQKFERTEMDQKYVQAVMYDIPEERNFKVQEIFWRGDTLYRQTADQEPRLSDLTIDQALKLMERIKNDKRVQGDILFFLPGYYQIQTVKRRLLQANVREQRIIQVHSIFSQQLYEKLFLSKIQNKLILATNIGQSSITLPFCNIVIDFCLTKKNTIRQKGINQLETRFASKASLTQRAGRVGRVADGYVFRMITKQFYQTLPQYEQPQIKCISLQMIILRAKQLDYINNSKVFADPYRFLQGVMNPPNIEAIRSAIQHLIHQEALLGPGPKIQQASQLQLTKIGQFMVTMPCDMQISKMILMSIKLCIPGLVVAIASIMIATKMFFVHQQRRENIEQFMHSLIGYDTGLSNDYFLRQRIYNHWKQKFYYPIKEKRMYRRKVNNTQNKQTNQKEFSRKYEQDQQEAQEIAVFLQQFCHQKWSQIQKDFCFPRGLNLMTLRQIVKIEQNLRLRLKKLGVVINFNEKRNLNLFLLCLTYAFPDYSCQIKYSKYIKSCKKELNYVQLPSSWDITNKMIDQYVVPEREYQIKRENKSVRVYGAPKVLKKFIFPQFFSKSSITKYVSELFQNLARIKSNRFQCDITHQYYQVVVLNESINRVIIVNDYQKVYKLLTHQITMNNNRKLVKMSAIIDQQTYALIQLITNKHVQVSLHPSRQFLKSFKVDGIRYNFKRIISEDELNVIKNLRNVAIRKNTNTIHSSEQVMSQNDISTLLHFLESSNMKARQSETWERIFLNKNYSNQQQEYYLLTHQFQFNKTQQFLKEYQEWKKKQYYQYLKFYWPITLQECYIICGICEHIQPIQHAAFYEPEKQVLKMNPYSGSWVHKNNHLYCQQGHLIGNVSVSQDGQTSSLHFDKLHMYESCNKRVAFWKQWPSKEELLVMNQRSKSLVQELKQSINVFQCPFCFERDSDTTLMRLQYKYEKNFWKKVQQHLYSSNHLECLASFKKSLKKKQSS